MATSIDTPCWGCEERTAECHAKCERYAEFNAKRSEAREQKWKEHKEQGIADSYLVESRLKRMPNSWARWKRYMK